MKALKKESEPYMESIASAITSLCDNPSDTDLMELYCHIGEQIVQQGETAFIPHLAEYITANLPEQSGYSPRNLRRMRDFYLTYQEKPQLMKKALCLSFSQNCVIMDFCESDEQKAFYMDRAAQQKLSKRKLQELIESGAFEDTQIGKIAENPIPVVCPIVEPVCDDEPQATSDTKEAIKPDRQPIVPPCGRLHQGTNPSIAIVVVISPFMPSVQFHKLE